MEAGIRLVRRDCGGEEEGDDATSGSGAAGGTSQLRRCTVILWQLRAVMPEPSQTPMVHGNAKNRKERF